MNRKAQGSLALIFSVVGLLFSTAVGVGWQALTRANDAVDRTAKVESGIAEVNGKLDILLSRFGVSQKEVESKLSITTSSQRIDGHR